MEHTDQLNTVTVAEDEQPSSEMQSPVTNDTISSTPRRRTSARQIEANRRNALRSTGPRTPEGKHASRLNAFKHGLRAEAMVIPGQEDPAELDAILRDLREDWQPEVIPRSTCSSRLDGRNGGCGGCTAPNSAKFEGKCQPTSDLKAEIEEAIRASLDAVAGTPGERRRRDPLPAARQ